MTVGLKTEAITEVLNVGTKRNYTLTWEAKWKQFIHVEWIMDSVRNFM